MSSCSSSACQRPESVLLCRSGLFRPLRSPVAMEPGELRVGTREGACFLERLIRKEGGSWTREMSLVTSLLVPSFWTRRGAWYLVSRKVPMVVLGTGV